MELLEQLNQGKEQISMRCKSAILKLYESLEQESNTSPKYNNLLQNLNKRSEEFKKELTDKQKEQYSMILSIRNDMESNEAECWFVRGFKTSTALMIDVQN